MLIVRFLPCQKGVAQKWPKRVAEARGPVLAFDVSFGKQPGLKTSFEHVVACLEPGGKRRFSVPVSSLSPSDSATHPAHSFDPVFNSKFQVALSSLTKKATRDWDCGRTVAPAPPLYLRHGVSFLYRLHDTTYLVLS